MLALLMAIENPLAAAVEGYWAGEAVAEELQALHEAHPSDTETAYWLARVRLEQGQCEQASELLEGLNGEGPNWRLRAVEGLAAVCLSQLDRAWDQLSIAAPDMSPDPLREQVWASLGVLAVRRGEPGAAWLHRAGGDPARVLAAPLRRVLDDALIGVEAEGEGLIRVRYGRTWWALDLATGLGRPIEVQVQAPPDWLPETARDVSWCGEEVLWASPRGVERGTEHKHSVVLVGPPGFSLEGPQCYDEQIWALRRGGGVDVLVHGSVEQIVPLSVASFDVSERGVLLGTSEGIYTLDEGAPKRRVSTALPLSQPHWWP